MKLPAIPYWSLQFGLITLRIITFSTLFGMIAFPLIGLVIPTDYGLGELVWLGAQTLGLISCLIGPIAALILTARRITRLPAPPTDLTNPNVPKQSDFTGGNRGNEEDHKYL